MFAVIVGLCAIGVAKKNVWDGDHFDLAREPGVANTPLGEIIAQELLFFGAVIVCLVIWENALRHWASRIVSITLGMTVGLISLLNAFWLAFTGLQISPSVINTGLARLNDAIPIIVAGVRGEGLALLFSAIAAIVIVPFFFRALWRRSAPHDGRAQWLGIGLGVALVLFGALGIMAQGTPSTPRWRLIVQNIFVSYIEYELNPLKGIPQSPIPGPTATPLLDQAPSAGRPPNIIIFMMEATSYRASSFFDPRGGRTPFLAALSRRGLRTTHARSVMPHTSKALVAFLCGRYPAMQSETLETADNFSHHCLPRLLGQRGYVSALFQSADGTFEERPRLANNMGFDHFTAWQDLDPRPPQLGYLASSDYSLIEPVTRWASQQSAPFLITIVTSMTHHPYTPPSNLPDAGSIARAPPRQRYLALVRHLDRVLEGLVERLTARGLMDDTILAVLGDHGEGFGEHGLHQHNNLYFEEGLRVPVVIVAPGRIEGPMVIEENRSLMDVPPTLLDLIALPYREAGFDGRSLLKPLPWGHAYHFGCWYNNTCVGRVDAKSKLVLIRSPHSWMRYDLESDPLEQSPDIEAEQDRAAAEQLAHWLAAHRYTPSSARRDERTYYGRWRCGEDQRCRYRPTAPRGQASEPRQNRSTAPDAAGRPSAPARPR